MAEPLHAPHYRAFFRICAPLSRAQSWADVVQTLFVWLAQEANIGDLAARLDLNDFAHGCDDNAGHHRLRTQREQGAGTEAAPQYWAMRFEHPDAHHPHHRWHTDLGLTLAADGALDVALTLDHRLEPDLTGAPPEPPEITPPTLVQMLLEHAQQGWRFFAGSEPLSPQPFALAGDGAEAFWAALTDRARGCPLVLLMPDEQSGAYSLEPDRLASLLAGVAPVYAADRDTYDALQLLAPEPYRCPWRHVRIYYPGLAVANPLDFGRHRWFSHSFIERETAARVEQMILQDAVRGAARPHPPIVATLEELRARTTEIRQQQLHAAGMEGSIDPEWVELLQRDNDWLNEKIETLESEIEQYVEAVDKAERERDEANKNALEASDLVRTLEWRLGDANQRADGWKTRSEALERSNSALASFSELPESLDDVLKSIGQLYADRITFTERAHAAAAEATFDDVYKAWSCLFYMATDLWTLYFDQDEPVGDLAQRFRNRTGYELALNEGEITADDPDIMALRRDLFEGEEIDITPHVSIGSKPPDVLRVHYYPHRERQLIVVGHCGDHLKTAGTRRIRT